MSDNHKLSDRDILRNTIAGIVDVDSNNPAEIEEAIKNLEKLQKEDYLVTRDFYLILLRVLLTTY